MLVAQAKAMALCHKMLPKIWHYRNADFVFARKYMQPLLACNNFHGYFIKAESHENVAHWFNRAFEALTNDCYGYEFIMREELFRICFFIWGI